MAADFRPSLNLSPRIRAAYLAIQAILIPAWWAGLHLSPSVRALFLPSNELDPNFLGLMLPDIGLISGGSAASAGLILLRSRHAPAALWLLLGGLLYATLYTVAWTFLLAAPPLGLLLMLAAGIATATATILHASV